MDFTKQRTTTAKGVAICLMFIHHLYAYNYRLLHGNSYIPFIPTFNSEFYIASFGNICVSIFLFLSGYGVFLGWSRSQHSPILYSLKKLKEFYLTYWIYFLIFVPIGLIFFQQETVWNSDQIRYSKDPITFLMNFIGWSSSYNEEWWFIRVFIIILVFFCPVYLILAEKNPIFVVFISLFLLALNFKASPYKNLFNFAIWQPSFALGIICAKLNFFSSRYIRYFDKAGTIFVLFGLLLCILIDNLWKLVVGIRLDFLIAPFFIYFTVRTVKLLHLDNLFTYLGKYSFPLWLIHSFFCYYYFQDLIYFPRWSPLVFLLLTTISIISILAIEQLGKVIKRMFKKPERL
ncbi:acyltransferase [Nostoc sp. FACHB-152]|uniref:acyltransferase family protein n=1 Tax=unclassified Nostoc TaxID=2593658 RepID=UPI0016870E2D|nr:MULTISPECIES: acyltransferase [unclassified Nostoc]MBD2447636.1 acyltransferase [Nostoc sp. FACHB-152]MBD2470627.1 acyltransferase [Nostoc sp. FACHB-145]